MTTSQDLKIIRKIADLAMSRGQSAEAEEFFARVEAYARDTLGQDHRVWNWRVKNASVAAAKEEREWEELDE